MTVLVKNTETGEMEWREVGAEKAELLKTKTAVSIEPYVESVSGELVSDDYGSIDWANRTWDKGEKAFQEAKECRDQIANWLPDFMKREKITLQEAVNRKAAEGFKAAYNTVNDWMNALPEYQDHRKEKKNNPSKAAEIKRKQREKKAIAEKSKVDNPGDSRESPPLDKKVDGPKSEDVREEFQVEVCPFAPEFSRVITKDKEIFWLEMPKDWKPKKPEPKRREDLPGELQEIFEFEDAESCRSWVSKCGEEFWFYRFDGGDRNCGVLFWEGAGEIVLFLSDLPFEGRESFNGDKAKAYLDPKGPGFVWEFLQSKNLYVQVNPVDFEGYEEVFSDFIEELNQHFDFS